MAKRLDLSPRLSQEADLNLGRFRDADMAVRRANAKGSAHPSLIIERMEASVDAVYSIAEDGNRGFFPASDMVAAIAKLNRRIVGEESSK
jgi:hypothetical protein